MPKTSSAKRYAQAAFELARERGVLDQWAEGLSAIGRALQNEEFAALLKHARVTMLQKVRTIREALPDTDPVLQNLLCVLVARGLVEQFPGVERGYGRLLDQHRGREQVQVSSAVPLEEPERRRVSDFVAGLINKEVVMESRIDPSILGGLVIRVGDRLIDGSTRNRLEELGRRLQRYTAGASV
jgi:F-type H+-transporting ATPase subunit delta